VRAFVAVTDKDWYQFLAGRPDLDVYDSTRKLTPDRSAWREVALTAAPPSAQHSRKTTERTSPAAAPTLSSTCCARVASITRP
jgi:hypothetical protein